MAEICPNCKHYETDVHDEPCLSCDMNLIRLDRENLRTNFEPCEKRGWTLQKVFYTWDGEKCETFETACSYCGKPPIAGVKSPYCPNCGRKMT